MILAPLRGVTIRCFRETFATELKQCGFAEAITPFITAICGVDPLKDRELKPGVVPITPQFIGKDSSVLRDCLQRIKSAGFSTADLNCGCPFPMVRNKGRGSGILRTPKVFEQMLQVGCEVMGEGKFSIKARLGVEQKDELLKLMPIINEHPLRFLTVHARTAKEMYTGECDRAAYERVASVAKVPIIYNGDALMDNTNDNLMVGRAFIRYLGEREDATELLLRYIEASQAELCGERPVLGRIKELVAYWAEMPAWHKRWHVIKLCRSIDELKMSI